MAKSGKVYNSPAFVSVRTGPGSVAGAGETPPKGPGPAGMRKVNRFGAQEVPKGTTSGSTPKGMKTYMGR